MSLDEEEWLNLTRNMTLEEYLLITRGPQQLPYELVIPLTIVYSVIFLTGVFGNLAVCLVIVKNVKLHTATNYYLFSLAVSDFFLLLLGLPNDVFLYWRQYPWVLGEGLCKLRAVVSEMASYTSVLTIVAFSMERYFAICHPLLTHTLSGLSRAARIVALLWIVSFVCAIPFALYTKVNYVNFPPDSDIVAEESAFCGMLDENVPKNLPIYELSFVIFFLAPLCIIIFLYMKICQQIRSSSGIVNGTVHGETTNTHSRKSITRMLLAVVVTFFLCWAPFHAQRVLYVYGRGWKHYLIVNEWLYYIAGSFYYISSTMNPVLYNIMSANYRNAFRATLFGRRRSREYHSSVRSSYLDDRLPRSPSRRNHSEQSPRDVVVMTTPDKLTKTKSCRCSSILLQVPMSPDHSGTIPYKVSLRMETCM